MSGLHTECHAHGPIEGRVLCPRDNRLELSMVYYQPAYEGLQGRHTHTPKAECLSIVINLWLGHVQRMDRICIPSHFERYVELSITINHPYIPTEVREVIQLGTLGARVDCIHYIPVAQRKLGVRDTGKIW